MMQLHPELNPIYGGFVLMLWCVDLLFFFILGLADLKGGF